MPKVDGLREKGHLESRVWGAFGHLRVHRQSCISLLALYTVQRPEQPVGRGRPRWFCVAPSGENFCAALRKLWGLHHKTLWENSQNPKFFPKNSFEGSPYSICNKCFKTENVGVCSVSPACVFVYLAENHVAAGEKGTTNCLHRLKQWQLGVFMFILKQVLSESGHRQSICHAKRFKLGTFVKRESDETFARSVVSAKLSSFEKQNLLPPVNK